MESGAKQWQDGQGWAIGRRDCSWRRPRGTRRAIGTAGCGTCMVCSKARSTPRAGRAESKPSRRRSPRTPLGRHHAGRNGGRADASARSRPRHQATRTRLRRTRPARPTTRSPFRWDSTSSPDDTGSLPAALDRHQVAPVRTRPLANRSTSAGRDSRTPPTMRARSRRNHRSRRTRRRQWQSRGAAAGADGIARAPRSGVFFRRNEVWVRTSS